MVGIMMTKKQTTSNWWWLDSQSNAKRSPWLQSTISELDDKTKAMLKLIEEDADTFAKRAEMYYKKRPELISMVEDFYRVHRSLAERYDQIKSETPTRLLTTLGSPFSSEKSRPDKTMMDRNYDSYSESYEHAESDVDDPDQDSKSEAPEAETETPRAPSKHAESDVDDPDQDSKSEAPEAERETPRAPPSKEQNEQVQVARAAVDTDRVIKEKEGEEVRKLKEEISRLREENKAQKQQLQQKDEEKREVIRQLSLAVGLLKDENVSLRKSAIKETKKRDNLDDVKNSNNNNNNNNNNKGFFRKLFDGSFLNSQATVVAL